MLGCKDFFRLGLKHHDCCRKIERFGFGNQALEHGLVTKVHAIEFTNGQNTAFVLRSDIV
jgi:hypothetical protein